MPAIFYLSSAMNVKRRWKAPAVKNVLILFICLQKNKKRKGQEWIKEEMFLIRREKEGLQRGDDYGLL